MSVSFMGLGELTATFLGESIPENTAVKLSDRHTVTPAASGDRFIGIARKSRSGLAPVQLKGFVTMPYSGTAPVMGFQKLAAGTNGAVAANANGTEYLVIEVDTSAKTVGFFL